MTQLARHISTAGPTITVGCKTFLVEGISGDAELAVGTFRSARAVYHAVTCPKVRVAGKPGAEVWAVIGGRRTVCQFAVHEGSVFPVT